MTSLLLVATLSLGALSCSKPQAETKPEVNENNREPATVMMGLEAQRHVGMQFATVSVSQLTEYLQVTGTVQPVDSKVANIRPLARGRIQEVVVRVGDRVAGGQPLASFDNIEAGELASRYASARAELERLKVQWAAISRVVDRNWRLTQIGAIPAKDYEASQAEQEALAESIKAHESELAGIAARLRRFGLDETSAHPTTLTWIRAPFAGVVTKVQASPGEVVTPELVLFSIVDLSRVWVQAEVYEKDLGRIRLDQSAFITVDAYPGERFPGRVTYMSDFLDPQTRTARVRCEVPNGDLRLKLDMFVLVKLPTKFSRQGIAIPSGAIQELEGKNVVFVRKGPTKFEIRRVQPGTVIDARTEIRSGLREGEAIVVQGAFHLKSVALGKELAEAE